VEDLVLLHGFGGTRRAWDGLLGHLSGERYSALALDLPGHGEQADAPRPITFAGCVASVLDRSPARLALAGYSMGGRVALHVALESPERVSRLILISATAGIDDAQERSRRRESDRRLADEIERGSISDFATRWGAQPMFAQDPPAVAMRAAADQSRNRPDGVAAALRGIGTGEMQPLWGRLSELEMPVTVLVGDRDAKFRALGERMAELAPDARLVVVAGGHRLPYEVPKAVAEAIISRPALSPVPAPAAPRSPHPPGPAGSRAR
jgi:2-succinyl-6-hydroxy-2,4-cyclohexadiene-1-carboxylate synthase